MHGNNNNYTRRGVGESGKCSLFIPPDALRSGASAKNVGDLTINAWTLTPIVSFVDGRYYFAAKFEPS